MTHQFTPAKSKAGHCGTGATMNILNYFWKTDFGIEDTEKLETMIRFGKFHKDERPSEFEIALFLVKNNFSLQYYSPSKKGNFEFLALDPKKHQETYGYKYFSGMNAHSHISAIQSLFIHKNFEVFEGEEQNFKKIIQRFSDVNHVFLCMPDYFLIHDFPNPKNLPGGHIMMSSGFRENSEKMQFFESTPNTPDALFQNNPDTIFRTFEAFQKASWGDFFVISPYHSGHKHEMGDKNQ